MNIILNKQVAELYNLYKIFKHMGHITHCLWIKAYAVDTKTCKGMINTKFWIIWGGKEGNETERYKGSFSFCLCNFLLKYLEQMWGLKHDKAECYSLIVTCFSLKIHPFVLASATGKASEERSFSRGWRMRMRNEY